MADRTQDSPKASSNQLYLRDALMHLNETLGAIPVRDLMNGDMSGLVFVSMELQKLAKEIPSLVS